MVCTGEGGLTAAPPSKHEFLQYGVDNGGDRNTLAQGLGSCRDGSVKDITYKVCPSHWSVLLSVPLHSTHCAEFWSMRVRVSAPLAFVLDPVADLELDQMEVVDSVQEQQRLIQVDHVSDLLTATQR